MKKRTAWVLMVFGGCLAVLFAALGWTSWKMVQLERAEAEAGRRAAYEENVRLALWRMDSSLAPLIAQENARPYFSYAPFYAAERAYNAMFGQWRKGEVLIPSNLLAFQSPSIRIHFQVEPNGNVTSPQAPTGNMRDLAESMYVTPDNVMLSTATLVDLQRTVAWDELRNHLPKANAFVCPTNELCDVRPAAQVQSAIVRQVEKGEAEFKKRAESYAQNSQNQKWAAQPPSMPKTVREGWMQPQWTGGKLLLVRRVMIEEKEYLQGCWLDWKSIEKTALELVQDLFPEAHLEPIAESGKPSSTRGLATLPAELIPGPAILDDVEGPTPIRWSLIFAWSGAILAAVAVGTVVAGLIALGERRADFVSAVTHELRTPLTTFRLYADMLERGMVDSPERRQEYLGTMRKEADRLGHLVENVLSFSRLERGRTGACSEPAQISQLLDRCWPRLAERAASASMVLDRQFDGAAETAQVKVDAVTLEQILFNLIDNACKYAKPATEQSIRISCGLNHKTVRIEVRDFGPGIDPARQRKLFRPFSKSAEAAARSQPGVGLGLALCRRLARSLGGDVYLNREVKDGAAFCLVLPAV